MNFIYQLIAAIILMTSNKYNIRLAAFLAVDWTESNIHKMAAISDNEPQFSTSLYCTCHSPIFCDLIRPCLFTSMLRWWRFLFCCTAMPDPKGPSYFFKATVQDFSPLNILVNMVSTDHRAFCKWFCFRYHCTCRTWWHLKRSRGYKGLQMLLLTVLSKIIDASQ